MGKRLKVIGGWGFLLFAVTNGSAFLLVAVLGQITGLLLTVPIAVVFAGFAGYKAAISMVGDPGYDKKNARTMVGVLVAFFSAILSTALTYFLTGKLNYGPGLFTLVAAAIGGYIAERKTGSSSKFFGR